MKKPALLLVADDRSSLAPLGAHLTAAFGEVCTVRTFTPELALAAQQPDIALVVMAETASMSASELLERLQVAAGCEAITLPSGWQSGSFFSLQPRIAAHLLRYLASHRASAYYQFRELREEEEIRRHLALRYEVYRQTAGIDKVLPDGATLDIDAHDRCSWLIGVDAVDGGRETMIGTMRFVGRRERPSLAPVLRAIAADHPELSRRVCEPCQHTLPMLSYLVDGDAVSGLVERLAASGKSWCEPSRLTLDPSYRSAGELGIRGLAQHIIDSAVAFTYFHLGIDQVLCTCAVSQSGWYISRGFRYTPGTQTRFQPDLGIKLDCLTATATDISLDTLGRAGSMAYRLRRTGAICFCSSLSACQHLPYQTGDFSACDTLCPQRARSVLTSAISDPQPQPLHSVASVA